MVGRQPAAWLAVARAGPAASVRAAAGHIRRAAILERPMSLGRRPGAGGGGRTVWDVPARHPTRRRRSVPPGAGTGRHFAADMASGASAVRLAGFCSPPLNYHPLTVWYLPVKAVSAPRPTRDPLPYARAPHVIAFVTVASHRSTH